MSMATLPRNKTELRLDRESPYRRDHERAVESLLSHPQSLRDYLRELRDAVDAESVDKLHRSGDVETDQGTTPRMKATAIARREPIQRPVDNVITPKSAWLHEQAPIDTPKWSHDFRMAVSGTPFLTDVTEEGVLHWVSPLRSALARMNNASSGRTRLAARTAHALPFHRYSVHETWWALCGPFAHKDAEHMADDWALAALRTWWTYYIEQPRGKSLT